MEDGWRHVQRNGELKGTGEVAEGRAGAESGKYHSVRIYRVSSATYGFLHRALCFHTSQLGKEPCVWRL